MATLRQARTPEEMKKLGVAETRTAYTKLAEDYNRIIDRDLLLCPSCGDWLKADTSYYLDKTYATNRYPMCKRCIMKAVEQRKNDRDEPNETKESVQKVLKMMNRVYDDAFYEECVKGALDDVREKVRNSPFSTYITAISSLPNWKGKTWEDSDFGNGVETDTTETRKARREIRKLFGAGFSESDYLYLQDQYDEWRARTQVDSKSQETYIVQICFKQLDIWKAQKDGKDTDKLVKSLNDLMNGANLQPRQNVANASTDSLSFGQLIERWEMEKPIPEPEEEFKDVDNIGKYIRVWFAGHLSKCLGLKNAYSQEYDEYVAQYKVSKPESQGEGGSDEIYDMLFGKNES